MNKPNSRVDKLKIFKLPSICITGEINEAVAAQFCATLSELERRGLKRLRLDISSPGGCMESGMAIAARIQMSSIHITTYNLAEVASSAFVIFLAGDHRACSPYAYFLHHEPSASLDEDSISSLKTSILELEKTSSRFETMVSDLSGLSESYWRKARKKTKDVILFAIQAQLLGFVDQCGPFEKKNLQSSKKPTKLKA